MSFRRAAELGVDSVQPSRSSLFGSDPSFALQYREIEICVVKPIVKISHVVRSKGLALWDDRLIGQFLGSPLQLYHVQAVGNNLWGRRGEIDVIAWENKSFIFKFKNPQTKQWAMDRGPWFISQKALFLRNWQSGLREAAFEGGAGLD